MLCVPCVVYTVTTEAIIDDRAGRETRISAGYNSRRVLLTIDEIHDLGVKRIAKSSYRVLTRAATV